MRIAVALALVLAAPAAAAAEEEPAFWLTITAHGDSGSTSYDATTQVRFELCEDWPTRTDEQGRSASSGREALRLHRGLRGLPVGMTLRFCLVGGEGSGRDSDGSDVSMSVLSDGRQSTSGTEVFPGPPVTRQPFQIQAQAGERPARVVPKAEIVRTARGARLVVEPEITFDTGGATTVQVPSYYVLDKSVEQHRAWSTYELADEELARFGELVKTHAISLSEGGARLSLSVTVRARLPDLGEVLVEAKGYEDWRPMGNLADQEKPGNELLLEARVHEVGKPERTSDKKVTLTFELSGVSSQRGVCNNGSPPRQSAPSFGQDLRILKGRNEDFDVVEEKRATGRKPASRAKLVVSSYDFGGWGFLRATARDEKGREVPVTWKGLEGKKGAALPIPQDEDGNHIADSWQRKHDLMNASAEADDEKIPEGRHPGDGLTLYEEYRGFLVGGDFREGDPRRKDLFVCDASRQAAAGIALFQKVTELAVHVMTCEELGSDRVVNRYTGLGHRVDQHGLYIEYADTSPTAVGDRFGPPALTPRILVPRRPAAAGLEQEEFDADVAHELAHGVGVQHHSDDPIYPVVYRWRDERWLECNLSGDSDSGKVEEVPDGCATVQLLRESGAPHRNGDPFPGNFAWNRALGGWVTYLVEANGVTSGDDACLLRYTEKGTYRAKGQPSVRYIPEPRDRNSRTHLCSSAKGTGVNAADHKPQSRYGDAKRGSCARQVVVNDGAAP